MKVLARLRALPLVLRWALAGAVVPSALWLAVIVVGVFAEGPDAMVQAVGFLMLMIVVMGVPGAFLGLAVGCVDLHLGRRIVRSGRTRASLVQAVVVMTVILTGVVFLLQRFVSSGLTPLAWLVSSAVFAAVPVLVCVMRYRRIYRAPVGADLLA